MKNKKQKRKRGTTELDAVVLPFRRSLRPISTRKMPPKILHMTLAAAKARDELDGYFGEAPSHEEMAVLKKARDTLVVHFSELGVRFDAEGHPVFAAAPCSAVSLDDLVEEASFAAMDFLSGLEETLDLYFDLEDYIDFGWRHGFVWSTRRSKGREHRVIPVVLTLDLDAMQLCAPYEIIDRGGTDPGLSPLERLAAVQRPAFWKEWRAARAGNE